MANVAAKLFSAHMETMGMGCNFLDEDESVLIANWDLGDTQMNIIFNFGEDNRDVHIQGLNFLKVSEDKYGKALQIANMCNTEYRWIKFTVDMEHGQFSVEDDAVIDVSTCADEVFELMIRMTQIVHDAYPKMMKALWA